VRLTRRSFARDELRLLVGREAFLAEPAIAIVCPVLNVLTALVHLEDPPLRPQHDLAIVEEWELRGRRHFEVLVLVVPDDRLKLVRVDSLDLSDHSDLHFLVFVLRLSKGSRLVEPTMIWLEGEWCFS
jgi:hypothetical protein